MKFSVIIPAYNVEKYLRKCVESVLMQSYSDYEIIIIDDGSTDNTGLLADNLMNEYKGKIKVVHQKNKGLGGARNSGIDIADGDYLVFIDSDDFVRADMLSQAYHYIHDYDLDIVVFGFKQVKEDEMIDLNKDAGKEVFKTITPKEYLLYCGPSACNKIYRSCIFKDQGIKFPDKLLYEDIATIPLTAPYASKIGVTSSSLYFYVKRENSIISMPSKDRVFELYSGYDTLLANFKSRKLYDIYEDELEFLAIVHAFYNTLMRLFYIDFDRDQFECAENYMNSRFPDYRNNLYIHNESILNINHINQSIYRLFLDGDYRQVELKFFLKYRIKKAIKLFINKINNNGKKKEI